MTKGGGQETLGYENILVARVKKPSHLVNMLPPNQGNIQKSPSFLTIGIGIIYIYIYIYIYICKPGFKVPCTYTEQMKKIIASCCSVAISHANDMREGLYVNEW